MHKTLCIKSMLNLCEIQYYTVYLKYMTHIAVTSFQLAVKCHHLCMQNNASDHEHVLGSILCMAKHEPDSPLSSTLQRHNTENSKQIFSGKELRGLSPHFCIHVSVSDLYIPTIGLPILLQKNMWTDPGNIKIAYRRMNMKILTEAAQFLFWEYLNWIFVAVQPDQHFCMIENVHERILNIFA
jgi:hypothetical protein